MLLTDLPNIYNQWDFRRNTLNPDALNAGSRKVVWWINSECGHEYDKAVADQVKSPGCPYCAGQRCLPGFNDLVTRAPELAKEYHPTKNTLPANEVFGGGSKKVWWLGACGHEWLGLVGNRVHSKVGCPYCSNRLVLAGFNDLATKRPDLAAEWHPTKNSIEATQIIPGTARKVWWLGKCGHEWDMLVASRTSKLAQGCPYCSGKRVLAGFNDLASLLPDVCNQWHPTKNTLKPDEVTPGSGKKVWWKCEKGHEWEAIVSSRSTGNGCPLCAGKQVTFKQTRLKDRWPELEKNYSTKNNVPFEKVGVASHKNYEWVCDLGHEWSGAPGIFKNGYACPYCNGKRVLAGFNDIATTHPKLVKKKWDFEKNTLKPTEINKGSMKKVWWKCGKGHSWDSEPNSATRGRGCPYCAGVRILVGDNDLATTNPELVPEWHPTKNLPLTPQSVTAGANKDVWWVCSKGHEWHCKLGNRTHLKSGCPDCVYTDNTSKTETELADFVESLGVTVKRSDRKVLSGLELDILVSSHSVAIEFNGVYWHSEGRGKDKGYHQNKWKRCKEQGIRLIQVWGDDWRYNRPLVERLVTEALNSDTGTGQEQTVHPVVISEFTFGSVEPMEAEKFLVKNHIQGYTPGAKYFGFYKNLSETKATIASTPNSIMGGLVSIIGVTSRGGKVLEVARLAVKPGQPEAEHFNALMGVVLKERRYESVTELRATSVNDYSTGGIYAGYGFKVQHEGTPDYMYVYNNHRYHKARLAPDRIKTIKGLKWEAGLTETKLAKLNGLNRVWDSGSTLWVKQIR